MAKIKIIKEEDLYNGVSNESIYPITVTEAIYDNTGKSLTTIIQDIQKDISNSDTTIEQGSITIDKLDSSIVDKINGIDDIEIPQLEAISNNEIDNYFNENIR